MAVPAGDCNVTCGFGFQNTTLSCVDRRLEVVAMSSCANAAPVPTPAVPCRLSQCVTYQLVKSDFSPCSSSCGNGTMTRSVACRARDSGAPVPMANCVAGSGSVAQADVSTSLPCYTPCSSRYR